MLAHFVIFIKGSSDQIDVEAITSANWTHFWLNQVAHCHQQKCSQRLTDDFGGAFNPGT